MKLNRKMINILFNASELSSEDFFKKFCESYKINLPADIEAERSPFMRSGGKQYYYISYSFRDKRGFNLKFFYNDYDPGCSLRIEATQSDAVLKDSFN